MSTKGIISWHNPTTNTDGSAFDANAQAGGFELQFDGAGVVDFLFTAGVNVFDMNTLDAYKALAEGPHNVALAIVNKSGVASAFSAPVTFQVTKTPDAPSAVAVD